MQKTRALFVILIILGILFLPRVVQAAYSEFDCGQYAVIEPEYHNAVGFWTTTDPATVVSTQEMETMSRRGLIVGVSQVSLEGIDVGNTWTCFWNGHMPQPRREELLAGFGVTPLDHVNVDADGHITIEEWPPAVPWTPEPTPEPTATPPATPPPSEPLVVEFMGHMDDQHGSVITLTQVPTDVVYSVVAIYQREHVITETITATFGITDTAFYVGNRNIGVGEWYSDTRSIWWTGTFSVGTPLDRAIELVVEIPSALVPYSGTYELSLQVESPVLGEPITASMQVHNPFPPPPPPEAFWVVYMPYACRAACGPRARAASAVVDERHCGHHLSFAPAAGEEVWVTFDASPGKPTEVNYGWGKRRLPPGKYLVLSTFGVTLSNVGESHVWGCRSKSVLSQARVEELLSGLGEGARAIEIRGGIGGNCVAEFFAD